MRLPWKEPYEDVQYFGGGVEYWDDRTKNLPIRILRPTSHRNPVHRVSVHHFDIHVNLAGSLTMVMSSPLPAIHSAEEEEEEGGSFTCSDGCC